MKAQVGMDQFHKIFASERRQEYLLSRIESPAHSTKSPVHFLLLLDIHFKYLFSLRLLWSTE